MSGIQVILFLAIFIALCIAVFGYRFVTSRRRCPKCGRFSLIWIDRDCMYVAEGPEGTQPMAPARQLFECQHCQAQYAYANGHYVERSVWGHEADDAVWKMSPPRVCVVTVTPGPDGRTMNFGVANRSTGETTSGTITRRERG